VITTESVKAILQIKTSNHDPYIEVMVPLLVEFTKEWCNNSFKNEQDKEEIPSGVQIFVAKSIEYLMNKSGVASRTMGSVSYSYDLDFPPSVMKFLKPYRKVRFS
jgi:hypothetical protein